MYTLQIYSDIFLIYRSIPWINMQLKIIHWVIENKYILHYIFAQISYVNLRWHLEKWQQLTNLTRSNQEVNIISFISWWKGNTFVTAEILVKSGTLVPLDVQNEWNYVYFLVGSCEINHCCQICLMPSPVNETDLSENICLIHLISRYFSQF